MVSCACHFIRVSLSTTPTDSTVEEELVTSSDGQSYDSETPLHSSVDHTPQVSVEFNFISLQSILLYF